MPSRQTRKWPVIDSKIGMDDRVFPLIKDEGSESMIRPIALVTEGDLVLKVKDAARHTYHHYLVSKKCLCDSSRYFATLLDPTKFFEGVALHDKMGSLVTAYGQRSSIPLAQIPVITIDDIGEVPAKVSAEASFVLFLSILHGLDPPWNRPDWSFIAILAVIADRFDAVEAVAEFIRHRNHWVKRCFAWDEKKPLSVKDEETVRQQILVGLLFGLELLLRKQTATLVVADSVLWTVDEVPARSDADALWWNLPRGLEGTLRTSQSIIGTIR